MYVYIHIFTFIYTYLRIPRVDKYNCIYVYIGGHFGSDLLCLRTRNVSCGSRRHSGTPNGCKETLISENRPTKETCMYDIVCACTCEE